MSDPTPGSASEPLSLPDNPNLEWLRKHAKRRHDEMLATDANASLADAQFDLAKRYGFTSWRAMKAHIDSQTVDGQLFHAAKSGNVAQLQSLLDEHPDKRFIRDKPYEHTLLHAAARHPSAVQFLLSRGLDVNARERGDNTYAMHWAAAAGELASVRLLADAGGDVVGHGDDHELEVIGWATCWDGCNDAAHREVADFLVSRGARHHIFSAIALSLDAEVRRIVTAEPSALARRMSRNENHQLPLHFAVRMNLPAMASLLVDLGADPLGVDNSGMPAAAYVTSQDSDRAVMEAIHAMTSAELRSAERGSREPRVVPMDLLASLVLDDWNRAERLVRDNPSVLDANGGVLHIAAKRGDIDAVKWLLAHGADPNGLWPHWDAEVTPLHLVAFANHREMIRVLVAAGANPNIRDTKHNGDAADWARFFRHPEIVRLLEAQSR